MEPFLYTADNEADTERLGAALAHALPPGAVVALMGPLGAGKTRLVQAVAAALDVPRNTATSPTFVLVHEYRGRRPVFHLDAYRLRDEDEFLALGPEEYFESDGITMVEWADRVIDCLPAERLEIRCEPTGATERRYTLTAKGDALTRAVRSVCERLS